MKKHNKRPRPNQKARRKSKRMRVLVPSAMMTGFVPISTKPSAERLHVRHLRKSMKAHVQTSPAWKVLKKLLDETYAKIPASQRAC